MRKQASPEQARHERSPGLQIVFGQSPEGASQLCRAPYGLCPSSFHFPWRCPGLACFGPLALLHHAAPYRLLTDDDLTFAEGKDEELLGRLEKKLGRTKEEIRAELARL